MEKLKQFFQKNFEGFFVLTVFIAVIGINYFIPHKVAFLNLYFLPVIMAGYYLDLRSSILGAFLCITLVTVYMVLYPQRLEVPGRGVGLILHIISWGVFLILAGSVVGRQQQKLKRELIVVQNLNEQLKTNQNNLNNANSTLEDYSDNLEGRVKERTDDLARSKEAVETLKNKVEDTLYATMDSSVVKLIIEGRLLNEKRKVSVMFSDLVGFTKYSENRSPELLIRDLNNYLDEMEPILLEYHGHIDKYMGDGIMVEFGAPIDFEQYRLLSVLTAIKMQEKMKTLGFPWKMRIGIASGSSIMGLIGSRRQSYTSIGDVVNLASRMERACPAGSILIDDFTFEGVKNFIDVRLKKALPLTGETGPNIEAALDALIQRLNSSSEDKEKADIYNQLGRLHMSIGEIQDAANYYERALQIQPDNVELKVVFAEAKLKQDEKETMKVKGRKQRVAAYEVIGIKDMLSDRDKIPELFYRQYSHFQNLITIPYDVVLPIEALDGCVGHAKVVAILSYAIASELGVYEQEKVEILHGGLLADLGKEIIPHHILNRSENSLNELEMNEVRKHPEESICIMKKMGYDSNRMLEVVRHSHEKFDGSGYPDGIRGESIPLGSRIIAVADAYDSLTSWRPYREKWDKNAAFSELKRWVQEGLYDPKVVKTLVKVLS